MENNWWDTILNTESPNSTWDITHLEEWGVISLSKYSKEDELQQNLEMTYEEFKDLSNLIMRLNGK